MAQPMLEAIAPTRRLIADKAYDADRLRLWLGERGVEAVIPGRASRDVAYPLNRAAYRRRNIIERMFRQAQELEANSNTIRSPCRQLSRRNRSRGNDNSMACLCPLPIAPPP